MATWYITCVKKDDRGVIQQVGLSSARNGTGRFLQSKAYVVGLIASGNQVLVPNNTGLGLTGDPQVHVVHGVGGPFLRTAADGLPGDNLGNLPDC